RRALVAAAEASAANLGWTPEDRWYLTLPPAHVGGLSVLLRCLLGCRAVVLGPPRFSPGATARDLAAHRITLTSLVPTMLHRLLHAGWRPPRSLRAVLLGGAPATASLLARAEAAGVPALPTYGATETCAQAATRAPGTPPTAAAGVGRPLAGVALRIVEGRVELRGPSLFDGYLGADGALDPARTADGWWPSGDLGTLDAAGQLHLRGRRADLIVTGGENVYPAEVEARLAEVLPGALAAVVGLADDEWGERVAVAFEGTDERSARQALESAALVAHQRPRALALVPELPRTPAGKIDRGAVRRLAFHAVDTRRRRDDAGALR
ncbi:MAG: AMP-binding protein, partial [Myxococcota bacterium]